MWPTSSSPGRGRSRAAEFSGVTASSNGPASGPLVFLTGASSGIGAALARHYARRGARLGLVARQGGRLAEVAGSLPGEPLCYAADVADVPALAEAAADFMARRGMPDVVIANAGISVGTLTEYAEDLPVFERILRTNVLGVVATFQPFLAAMRARGSGRLVGTASVAGIRGLGGLQRLQGRPHHLAGKPARGTPWQRSEGGDPGPWLHRHAHDGCERLSHALPHGRRPRRRPLRRGHRSGAPLHRGALADGLGGAAPGTPSAPALRGSLRPGRAQAARTSPVGWR